MPAGWRLALRAAALAQLIEESAMRITSELQCGAASCYLLGAPGKPMAGAHAEARQPGTILQLRTSSGAERQFMLCAHVSGSMWYCHPGSILNDDDSANPFDPAGLQLRDLDRPVDLPAKRCRVPPNRPALEHYVGTNAFYEAIAIAAVKAEELNARLGSRPFNRGTVMAAFIQDPWAMASIFLLHI